MSQSLGQCGTWEQAYSSILSSPAAEAKRGTGYSSMTPQKTGILGTWVQIPALLQMSCKTLESSFSF